MRLFLQNCNMNSMNVLKLISNKLLPKSLGLINSVQPNFLANSRLSELISTPMILLAPAVLQPNVVDKPIAPKPHTAHVEPE